MITYVYRAYKIVDGVIRNKAYSSIELNHALNIAEEEDKAIITKIVYGVLENSVKYDYIISRLCDKKPKASIVSLLKVGMYMLSEVNSIPDYAAIDECVKIAKLVSRGSLTGFVNGYLRKYTTYTLVLPENTIENFSVKYSVPLIVVKKLITEYGESLSEEILSRPVDNRANIRSNGRIISGEAFYNELRALDIPVERVADNCFLCKPTDLSAIEKKKYTIQARASVIDVDCLNLQPSDEVLDACAAPGGKAIYAAETAKSVSAFDIHEHRVLLIRAYAERMKANNVTAELLDGTTLNKEFIERFDKVLCDVPCTGSGVMHTKPDVLTKINESNILDLNALQYKILNVNAQYVKRGGVLQYSTCSLFNEENDGIISKFLSENDCFSVDEELSVPVFSVKKKYGVQLLPNKSGTVGFYISRLIKK